MSGYIVFYVSIFYYEMKECCCFVVFIYCDFNSLEDDDEDDFVDV